MNSSLLNILHLSEEAISILNSNNIFDVEKLMGLSIYDISQLKGINPNIQFEIMVARNNYSTSDTMPSSENNIQELPCNTEESGSASCFDNDEEQILSDDKDSFTIKSNEVGEQKKALATIPIEHLDFTVRTYNCLKRMHLDYIGALFDYSDEDFLKMRNFGKKSLEEITRIKQLIIDNNYNVKSICNICPNGNELEENTSIANNIELTEGTSIATLNMSKRTYNCLMSEGINTLEKLIATPNTTIAQFRNLGAKSLAEIKIIKEAYSIEESTSSIAADEFDQVSIKEIGLSNRSYNVLKRLGINTVGDLLRTPSDSFANARNVGSKTISDIIAIKEMYIKKLDNSANNTISKDEYNDILNILGTDVSKQTVNKVVNKGLRKKVIVSLNDDELESLLSIDCAPEELSHIINNIHIYKNNNFNSDDIAPIYEIISNRLQPFISHSKGYIYYLATQYGLENEFINVDDVSDINNCIWYFLSKIQSLNNSFLDFINSINPNSVSITIKQIDTFFSEHNFSEETKEVVEYLVSQTDLFNEIVPNYFVPNTIGLNEYLDGMDDSREKQMLLCRLNGDSLQKLGDSFGVTRERARQIVNKTLMRFPTIREDVYASPYMYFNFKKKDFLDCFGIDNGAIFEYCALKYKHGLHDFNEEDIEHYLGDFKTLIKNYSNSKTKSTHTRKIDICKKVLINNMGHYISKDDFEKEYFKYIEDNNLDADKYNANLHGMLTRFRMSKHVAFDKEGRFRFYERNAAHLWDQLNFTPYKDSIISAELIYKDNAELMDEYDIWNGYELYHLLKATQYEENSVASIFNISFRRIPTIIVGNGDEEDQVVKLLKELAPISYWDFFAAYEEKYGTNKESAAANLFKYISKYYNNTEFRMDLPPILPEEAVLLKEKLSKKDIWLIDELQLIFSATCINSDPDSFNAISFRNLGYVLNSGYAYSNKYSNAVDCVEDYYCEDGIFDLNKDEALKNLSIVNSFIDKMRNSLDYVEVYPQVYYSSRKIQEVYGLSVNEMKQFIQEISASIKDKYYNGDSIKSIIADSLIAKKMKNNYLMCTSLLRKEPGVYSIRFSNTIVLTRDPNNFNIGSICEWIADGQNNITINQLRLMLKDKFNIDIDNTKLIEKLKQHSVYDTLIGESYDSYIDSLDSDFSLDDVFDEEFF